MRKTARFYIFYSGTKNVVPEYSPNIKYPIKNIYTVNPRYNESFGTRKAVYFLRYNKI